MPPISKTVLITGASAGVGRATARAFAREGARIGLIARDRQRLDDVANEVTRLGGSALAVVADIAEADQVEQAATKVEAHFGAIDIWVNNATVKAIWANKFFPGLLDRYLAQTGYSSEQTDEPEAPGRPDNLWRPVPGAFGAHGSFDDRAKGHSTQLWLSERKWWGVALFGAGMAVLTTLACKARWR